MQPIHWPRIAIGAIAGGILWFALGTARAILLAVVIGADGSGPQIGNNAAPEYLPVAFLVCVLFAGIVAASYAAVRERMRPGAGTALRVGLVVGLAIELTDLLWLTGLGAGAGYRFWAVLTGVVDAMLVALLVGWMYQEPAAATA